MFSSSFARQKLTLERGAILCSGQPCQKQPSTNTATLGATKQKSGLPGSLE